MSELAITTSKGEFAKHEPSVIDYYTGFAAKADFLVFEAGMYDRLNLPPDAEVTFKITPTVGDPLTFVGQLYAVERTEKVNTYRMHFVSRYFKKLMSAEPLFGKGKTTEIAEAFYRQAGVPQVHRDSDSDMTLDNIVFPRTTRLDQAITYLLNRSPTVAGGFVVGTVVGDAAYLRDIRAGQVDHTGLYYQVLRVKDERRRVDVMGGLKMDMGSDSEDVPATTATKPSKAGSETKNRVLYTIDNTALAQARLRVKQARMYYGSYSATVGIIGWSHLLGSNIVVNSQDVFEGGANENPGAWMPQLDVGKYFVYAQAFHMDFKQSYPKSQCALMLVA